MLASRQGKAEELAEKVDKSKKERDQGLRKELERTREVGIKWNADKCVFGAKEVSYFGHVLSDKGVQPDPKKIAAIQEMEPPKTNKNSRSYLEINGELFS